MKWGFVAIVDFIVGLLAFPLSPLIVLLTNQAGISPAWCWPWLTSDNPIDGDEGHMERWPDNGTNWRVFCRRVAWLWRNRGYGFSERIAGAKMIGKSVFYGDREISSDPYHSGWCYVTNNSAWEFYAIYAWNPWLCLRIRLGWKIPLSIDVPTEDSMIVEYINPFKGYNK